MDSHTLTTFVNSCNRSVFGVCPICVGYKGVLNLEISFKNVDKYYDGRLEREKMKKNLIFVSCIPCIPLQKLNSGFQQLSNQCEVDVTSLELFWEVEEKGELDGKNSHITFLISSPMEMMCLPSGEGLVSTDLLVKNLEGIKEFFFNNFQSVSIVEYTELVKHPMSVVSTLIPGLENAFKDGTVALHLPDFSVTQKIESMAAVRFIKKNKIY